MLDERRRTTGARRAQRYKASAKIDWRKEKRHQYVTRENGFNELRKRDLG